MLGTSLSDPNRKVGEVIITCDRLSLSFKNGLMGGIGNCLDFVGVGDRKDGVNTLAIRTNQDGDDGASINRQNWQGSPLNKVAMAVASAGSVWAR